MGWGVPEAGRQCYNSPMNSDLSGRRTTTTRPRMPFLGRTLDRGPTKSTPPPVVAVVTSYDQTSHFWYTTTLFRPVKDTPKSALYLISQALIPAYPNNTDQESGHSTPRSLLLLLKTPSSPNQASASFLLMLLPWLQAQRDPGLKIGYMTSNMWS